MTRDERIIELYESGLSISQIARLGTASQPTISKVLKKNNINIRKGNGQKKNLPIDEINRLYNEGSSTYEIAALFHCSDETIRKLIKKIRSHAENNRRRPPEVIAKISESCKLKWQDAEYRSKVECATNNPDYKQAISDAAKANYKNTIGAWIKTDKAKKIISEQVKSRWRDKSYRDKQKPHYNWRAKTASDQSRSVLSGGEKREEWIGKIKEANAGRITSNPQPSMQQLQLYYLLDANNISFYREGPDTRISDFYVVDCIIDEQHQMERPLIVEVQGEYWHSLPHVKIKDRQKATYISRHTNYDLLYLDEIDFKNFNLIREKLRIYGLHIDNRHISLSDIIIKEIKEKEARLFYETFHYSSSVRKGAHTFGAFVDETLIAAISYTPPIRMQVAKMLAAEIQEVREISRLARASHIICDNLLSWFISKTIKLTPKFVKIIVSYSDPAYGHSGGVYRASNFVEHGKTASSYHYEDQDGKIWHKKTIWDRSKKFKKKESEYAFKHGMIKVIEPPKSRWVFRR